MFSLPDDLIYLNMAYMSPNLVKVGMAGIESVLRKNNPTSISQADFFEPVDEIRRLFSQLINNAHPDKTTIIPSVSYGIANVAQNVPLEEGEEIIIVGEQFPSNYYVWERVANEAKAHITTIAADNAHPNRGADWNQRILDAITPKTKVVTMPIVHWADGTLFDLKAIRAKTSACDALLVIDGTQSIGALPFDLQEIPVDALICAAYKWLLGPYSMGVAYYGDFFKDGTPIEDSWMNHENSDDFANLVAYNSVYRSGARRYEVGEASNFTLLPMFKAALEQVLQWQPQYIQDYCRSITEKPLAHLVEKGFKVEATQWRSHHLFGIRLAEGMDMEQVKKRLKAKNIFVSYRGDAIRVAPHLYNVEGDLEALALALV